MNALILFLFFFSGAIALGYQVLWGKLLLEFIGVSAYSYATVLAAFMCGLALGSWVLGRYADRSRNPLRMYAYLELAVGLYALIYPWLSGQIADTYSSIMWALPDQAGGFLPLLLKILASGLLLVLPAAAMGGTYPALMRQAPDSVRSIGRKAAQLYSVNAAGAVAGIALMTFLLMPVFGMHRSLMFLAVANGSVALIAWLLSFYSSPPAQEAASGTPAPIEQGPELEFTTKVKWALWIILAQGVLSFVYEVAWTRFFGLALGSSTYSFSVMLAAFITGITTGSALLARMESRVQNPLAFFGWTQIIAALLIILPLPLYPYIPWLFKNYGEILSYHESAFYLYEAGKLILCYALMLPPTIFIGMALPLVVKGTGKALARLGADTGRVYSWNTWGNVAGALLSGLFLLPLLGIELLLRISAVAGAALGMATILLYSAETLGKRRKVFIVGLTAFIVIFGSIAGSWDTRWFLLSPTRRKGQTQTLTQARNLVQSREILLFKDDPAAHIIVKRDLDVDHEVTIFVNGKADASSGLDMATQELVAHIPLILHPKANDVLLVGLASGITSAAALSHPVQRLDVVDIVRAMPDAARFFESWTGNLNSDPRYSLIIDDARNYISYAQRKYDVIISQPSNPWTAGTGSLFSGDFYARALSALKPDGIYVQWVQIYETSDASFGAVVRSFRKVFPFIYTFQGGASDLILIGSLRPIGTEWQASMSRFQNPEVRKRLDKIQINDFSSLLYLQRYSPGTMDWIAAAEELENTDDNRYLEYHAPRDLFQKLYPFAYSKMDERIVAAPSLFWSRYPDKRPVEALRLLTRNQVAQVTTNLQLACFYLFGGVPGELPAPVLALLPESVQVQPPLQQNILIQRMNSFLAENDTESVELILSNYSGAMCTLAAASPEQSALWIEHAKHWRSLSPADSELFRSSQMLYIDLLLASHKEEEAFREIQQWSASASPPPLEWAMLRALRISRQSAMQLAETMRTQVPSPVIDRLKQLPGMDRR